MRNRVPSPPSRRVPAPPAWRNAAKEGTPSGHQTDHERADGLAQPRPIAPVQYATADPARSVDPATPDALFVNQSRFRQSRDRGRAHGDTKLPQREPETFGQSVPQPKLAARPRHVGHLLAR